MKNNKDLSDFDGKTTGSEQLQNCRSCCVCSYSAVVSTDQNWSREGQLVNHDRVMGFQGSLSKPTGELQMAVTVGACSDRKVSVYTDSCPPL